MFKQCFFILLFFLAGCKDDIDADKLLELANDDVPRDCVLATLNKNYNIHFNTVKRVYDFNLNAMKNVGDVDTVSVDYSEDLRYAKQMELLVEQELFVKTEYYINKGNFNLSGYFTNPISFQTFDGNLIENTLDRPGGQYKLTEKGKQYIKVNNETHELSLCIGYLVPNNINFIKESNERYKVFYRVKIGEQPEWLTKEIIKAFPTIETEMINVNKTRTVYHLYVTKNAEGEFSVN